MKVKLEFDDKNEALRAMQADKLISALAHILEELRRRRKYSDCEVSEELEDLIWEKLEEDDLSSLIY